MPSNYRKGANYEYKLKREFEKEGDTILVIRSAGSHGPVDLVVFKNDSILLVQAKKIKGIKSSKVYEIGELKEMFKDSTLPVKILLNKEIIYDFTKK